MSDCFDVIIAGAGPVGLFLACELAMANVSVLILEKEVTCVSPWKEGHFGRRGLFTHAVEAFHRRGLLEKILNGGPRFSHFGKTTGFKFGGHFAGMNLNANNIDFQRWQYRLPGPSFMPGVSSLGQIEAVLTERAQTMGVQIRRDMAVSQVHDSGENVRVWAGDQCFEAQWLVGCDGGRSTVRNIAGFKFEGTEAEFIGYTAKCELDKPELLGQGFCRTKTGLYIVTGPGHLHVMDFDTSFDRLQPITREHFQDVLRRVSGTDIGVNTLHLASSFTDRSKQVTEYRRGRVLLAGDSAHINSPLGAQGLNTGIADAINVGWKLAATVKNTAPPGLLDTYHDERYPNAAWVLEWTRAQVVTLRPDAYGKAVANIVQSLISTEDGASYFADRMWGISMRYDLGNAHPLVGCSAPDFEFDDGLRLANRLEQGGFVLVDFQNSPSAADFVQSLGPMVHYSGSHAKQTLGLKALLVRPDGIVVWASTEEMNLDAVKTALSRWVNLEV
ncbi:FAD binding domain-containing protein [Penicillium alfredii]|uniref:FAD binding domain-containing protein n=1 Tax=Penicillium alfredii TaxID=1506179 RepID=A0A9W9GBC8_9EURO|nr:FAD binding domain-containing protein [Penicillium alfredii]KAJ5115338.1 FAD binding domain-containing protein [Penicillium alfredii]